MIFSEGGGLEVGSPLAHILLIDTSSQVEMSPITEKHPHILSEVEVRKKR